MSETTTSSGVRGGLEPPTDPHRHDDGPRREGARGIPLSTRHRLKVVFAAASLLSLALSVGLWISGERMQAIFVGLWVPSIHSLGTMVLVGEDDR